MSELQLSSLQHGVVLLLPTVEGLRDIYAKKIAERS